MLKVEIDGQAIKNIEFSGSGRELTESLCILIHCIYKTMNEHNPISAAGYRLQLQRIIKDPRFWACKAVRANSIYMDSHDITDK